MIFILIAILLVLVMGVDNFLLLLYYCVMLAVGLAFLAAAGFLLVGLIAGLVSII